MTEPQPPRVNRFARLRAASDRVPTKWFAGIGTGLFLAVTAAFGGLADVAAEEVEIAELSVGETHISPQLAITVERAVLIDSLRGAGAYPDEKKGERLLVLLVEMENRWDEPVSFAQSSAYGSSRTVHLAGDDREAIGLVREDDQTSAPWLQPGIPTLLAFSWTVGPGDYADGDDLRVELSDAQLQTGRLLYTGDRWTTPELSAVVTVPIEDVGTESGG